MLWAAIAKHPGHTSAHHENGADMRGVLGIPGTHRNAAMPPLMLELDDCKGLDIHELAQRINQLIPERSSDPAKLLSMKDMVSHQAMMPQMPKIRHPIAS